MFKGLLVGALLIPAAHAASIHITLEANEIYKSSLLVKRLTGIGGNHDLNGRYTVYLGFTDEPTNPLEIKCADLVQYRFCSQVYDCFVIQNGETWKLPVKDQDITVSCEQ